MGINEIKPTLINIIATEARLPKDFDCDVNLIQLGIQSLSLMKIQIEIAKKFAVKLKFRDFIQNNSVNKLTQYLADKLGAEDERNGNK